jgi:hypothetical protein
MTHLVLRQVGGQQAGQHQGCCHPEAAVGGGGVQVVHPPAVGVHRLFGGEGLLDRQRLLKLHAARRQGYLGHLGVLSGNYMGM